MDLCISFSKLSMLSFAQVGSRKRGEKMGTLSNARKPNQTECFYLKEDV